MADIVTADYERGLRRSLSSPTKIHEFLAFCLAGELYGIALLRIKEILSPPPMTEVPRAPRAIIGICSVRGMLVTVIDLRRRLRLPETETTRRSRILLCESESGEPIGLFVDEVKQVMRLTESEIEPAGAVLGGDTSEHVMGIGRPDGNLVVLLDLGSVLPH